MTDGNGTQTESVARSSATGDANQPHLSAVAVSVLQFLQRRLIAFPRELLEVIIAQACLGGNVLLLGRHGLGKTTVAQLVCRLLRYEWVGYDASKDDLVQLAGLPSAQAIAEGRLEFGRHSRTVWDKEGVFVDELNRAPRGESSLYLELIESHTLYGQPLPVKTVFAAANPEELYASVLRMDDALLDRFDVVIIVPTPEDANESDLAEIAGINVRLKANRQQEEELPDARPLLNATMRQREVLVDDHQLLNVLNIWTGRIVAEIGKQTAIATEQKPYLSFRAVGKLPNLVLDLLAFHAVRTPDAWYQDFVTIVETSARCCLLTKCRLPVDPFEQALRVCRPLLKEHADERLRQSDRLRKLELGSLHQRVQAAEMLANAELTADERRRYPALMNQLAFDVSTSLDEYPGLANRLWWAARTQSEEQHGLELAMFRDRLQSLLTLDEKALTRTVRVRWIETLDRKLTEESEWAPNSPLWR